jgi:hypothetical protein
MPNPFLFGKIVTGEHFCDRETEQRMIAENLAGGQSVVVISPRRMGKSSLLAVVGDRLEAEGMVCGRIDFFALNSPSKILFHTLRVCAEMVMAQETNLKRFLAVIGDTFKRTRIAIEPSPDGGISVKPELGLPLEVRTTLTEAVLGLDRFLAKKKKRGLLVLDEFQEITAVDRMGEESLEAEFRTVMQSARRLSFAFLGSRSAMLAEMFTRRSRPFFQAAKIVELGPIDRGSLRSYIRQRFDTVGIRIENPEPVLDLVEGHPDYTQRFCSHLYDLLAARTSTPQRVHLDEALMEQALREMLDRCALIFVPEWETYPLRQQQVLSLLAEKGPLRRVPSLDLAEYEMTHTTFNTALKELLRKGTVRKDRSAGYRLNDPVFRRWIAARGP